MAQFESKSGKKVTREEQDFSDLIYFIKEDENHLVEQWTNNLKQEKFLKVLQKHDKHGQTPLHIAILGQAPVVKIIMILHASPDTAKMTLKNRLPLHLALELNPNIILLEELVSAYEESVRIPDTDHRYPLHILLESDPFPEHFMELAILIAAAYPAACMVRSTHELLPLHTTLRKVHPPRLAEAILAAGKNAAAVRLNNGKFPLHIAIEKSFQTSTIEMLLASHPAALLAEMPMPGGAILPLEYALREKLPTPTVRALLLGGIEDSDAQDAGNNPRCITYAYAASRGFVTRFPAPQATPQLKEQDVSEDEDDQEEDDKGKDGKVNGTLTTPGRGKRRQQKRSKQLRFAVRPGDSMRLSWVVNVEMASEEHVSALKHKLEEHRGVPVDFQRLYMDNGSGSLIVLKDQHMLASYENRKDVHQVRFHQRYDILTQALLHRKSQDDDEIILILLRMRPESAQEDDQAGRTPLLLALQYDAGDAVIRKLMQLNPQATRQPVVGGQIAEFPLHVALEKRRSHVVMKRLLAGVGEEDWGPSGILYPDLMTSSHSSAEDGCITLPLHLSIEYGGTVDTMKLLLHKSCPILARNKGQSALECALANARRRVNEGAGRDWEDQVVELLLGATGAVMAGLEQLLQLRVDQMWEEDESSDSDDGYVKYQKRLGGSRKTQADNSRATRAGKRPKSTYPKIRPQAPMASLASKRDVDHSPWSGDLHAPFRQIFGLPEDGGPGLSRCDYDEKRADGFELSDEEFLEETLLRGIEAALEMPAANGQRPLHVAVVNNASTGTIERLVELGPRMLRAKDIDGRLPIHHAASCCASFTVIRRLLLYDPASVHMRDGAGRSPMQLAVTHRSPPGVVLELARADPSSVKIRCNNGLSMLERAAAADAPPHIISELLELAPEDGAGINLLLNRLPNNQASATLLKVAFQHEDSGGGLATCRQRNGTEILPPRQQSSGGSTARQYSSVGLPARQDSARQRSYNEHRASDASSGSGDPRLQRRSTSKEVNGLSPDRSRGVSPRSPPICEEEEEEDESVLGSVYRWFAGPSGR